jgi:hypothetical protein
VRKSKPATLLVVDFSLGIDTNKKKQKEKEKIINAIYKTDIKTNSIGTDIGIAWSLFKKKIIRWELLWKYNEDKKRHEIDIRDLLKNNKNTKEEDARISPFRTYIIESAYYDSLKGIVQDESFII